MHRVFVSAFHARIVGGDLQGQFVGNCTAGALAFAPVERDAEGGAAGATGQAGRFVLLAHATSKTVLGVGYERLSR